MSPAQPTPEPAPLVCAICHQQPDAERPPLRGSEDVCHECRARLQRADIMYWVPPTPTERPNPIQRAPLIEGLGGEPLQPDWQIPGIINRGTMNVIYSTAGIGKSFLCIQMAVAKATGKDFLGQPMKVGKAMYFDEENSYPDAQKYLELAWRGLDRPSLTLLHETYMP